MKYDLSDQDLKTMAAESYKPAVWGLQDEHFEILKFIFSGSDNEKEGCKWSKTN